MTKWADNSGDGCFKDEMLADQEATKVDELVAVFQHINENKRDQAPNRTGIPKPPPPALTALLTPNSLPPYSSNHSKPKSPSWATHTCCSLTRLECMHK